MRNKKKGEIIMTNVLENVRDFIEAEEIESNYQTPKIDKIFTLLKLKKVAKLAKDEIEKYTENNINVRNGRRVLKGTRITTKELLLIMSEHSDENGKDVIEYIREQYPSIDSEEKIIYGALYEVNKVNTLLFILKVWMNK